MGRMKKTTLAGRFAALRAKASLSMLHVANQCDIAETTVWKLEHGKSVRWETVHLILTAAFKIRPGSADYEEFQQLWVEARQAMAESQDEEFGTKRMKPAAVRAVRDFRKLVRNLSDSKIKIVLAAARRAAG